MAYSCKVILHRKKWAAATKWQHMEESQRHNVEWDEQTWRKHTVRFHYYDTQNRKKLINGDRNKNTAYLWRSVDWKEAQGDFGLLDIFCMLISCFTHLYFSYRWLTGVTQEYVKILSTVHLKCVNLVTIKHQWKVKQK